MSSSLLSLYIPIISDLTSETYIKKMFKTKNIGKIMKVDFVYNIVKNRREAFIHFEEWFDNEESKKLRNDILDPNSKTRFKYSSDNKYWPILVNKNPDKKILNPKYKILSKEEIKNSLKKEMISKTEKSIDTNNVKKIKS